MLRDGVITSAEWAKVECIMQGSSEAEANFLKAWNHAQEEIEKIKRRIEADLRLPADVVHGKPNYSSNSQTAPRR